MSSRPIPGVPDACARLVAALPPHLPGGVAYSPRGEVAGDVVLLYPPGIGLFRVQSDVIDYHPAPNADPVHVERFLWGAARSALLHLRGDVPLHGSAVVDPSGRFAIALCGMSGAGKSTAAAGLNGLGWTMLADDQARVTIGDGRALVWPGPPTARLCGDACTELRIDTRRTAVDIDDRAKHLVPFVLGTNHVRLVGIVELAVPDAVSSYHALAATDALATVMRHVVGPHKWSALRTSRDRFKAVVAIVACTPVLRFHRTVKISIKANVELLDRLGRNLVDIAADQ